MARTAKEYSAPAVMKLEGDGLEDVIVTHFLERAKRDPKDKKKIVSGADRKDTFTVRVPKNAAGIIAYQKSVNEAGGDGNDSVITALKNAIVKQAGAARKEADTEKKDLPNVLSLRPDFGSVRVTDPNEAAASDFLSGLQSGKISMDSPEVRALFGKLAKK